MLDQNGVMMAAGTGELGMVICKHCGEVICTLPTNGVKKIYGVCPSGDCAKKIQMMAGEPVCR